MKLYGYWRSTAAYRVRIALNLKGLEYENASIDLVKDGGQQHTTWYQAINPQELVPSLELDDGRIIGQSMAIIEYLEETYPEPTFLPGDSVTRAQTRQLAQIVGSDIHPLNNLRVLNYLKESLSADQQTTTHWYHHWLRKGFDTLEALIDEDGPFAMGSTLSLADLFIVPQLYNAHRFEFPLEPYKRLVRVESTCLTLDEFSRAAPENQQTGS